MPKNEDWDEHEKFKELCALAECKSLSASEQLDLDRHLKACASCRDVYESYTVIGRLGMAFLAADDHIADDRIMDDARNWNNHAMRDRIQSAIRNPRPHRVTPIHAASVHRSWTPVISISRKALAIASVAACAAVVLVLGAYRMGEQKNPVIVTQSSNAITRTQSPVREKDSPQELLAAKAAQISRLEKQIAIAQEELKGLRAESIANQQRIDELGSAIGQKAADVTRLTGEHDQLAIQLTEKEKAYEILQSDYSNLHADHSHSLLHTASLESELNDLQSSKKDQEARLKDDEQYLTSDRDIRELMGARKLYIADVFDVDSASRTKRPFGRVFYTQSKSLVFYAFDLDHQPGVKNASVFQVWGQHDGETSGAPHPMNLGILYMDSESNRRWVLRSDDPKQLAEIDAVFVTVEPHGGSQKPTGKPLLYALLRKEANHP